MLKPILDDVKNLYEKGEDVSKFFTYCCTVGGSFDVAQYLLSLYEENKLFIDIEERSLVCLQFKNYRTFKMILKTAIKKRINPYGIVNHAFCYGCMDNRLDIVKYLSKLPICKERSFFHFNPQKGLIDACEHNEIDVIKYLIFEMNVVKDFQLEEYFKINPHESAEKWLDMKKLNEHLQACVEPSSSINIKTKI